MTPTSDRPRLRRLATTLATLGLTAGLALVSTVPADAGPRHHHPKASVDTIALPDGFQPEGIATGRGLVYSGSRVSGDIYVASLRTGKGRILSTGPGTPSLGLKVDGRRLWVAGGSAGDGRVVSTRTGKVLASFALAKDVSEDAPSFVNDVVLTKRYAWFTDSARPQLYRVDRRHPERAVKTVPLTGAWEQTTGNNANGITRTPDGRALLVVQSSTGYLFRVSKGGVATRVDLGASLLTNGDGLLLRGRTLYAVQNQLNQVAVVTLNRAGTKGSVRRTITSPAFDVPSTVAYAKGYLYLPNARFSTEPTPTTTYSINRVRA